MKGDVTHLQEVSDGGGIVMAGVMAATTRRMAAKARLTIKLNGSHRHRGDELCGEGCWPRDPNFVPDLQLH